MLINYDEYRMMYEAEEKLWWYKVLHEKVLKVITENFGNNKQIKILDAGCGTGGLMSFLAGNGYSNIEGFDFSADAVSFCNERKLNVKQIDITDFDKFFEDSVFDVIINNDVVYQFDNLTIQNIFYSFQKKIKHTGIIITNNNAFKIFYGTHDIAVGGKQRFSMNNFEEIFKPLSLIIIYYSYWSWILSPLILSVRLLQQIQLKFNLINLKNVKSDVVVPSSYVNNILYRLVKLEERILKKGFFGSSLFMVLQIEKSNYQL